MSLLDSSITAQFDAFRRGHMYVTNGPFLLKERRIRDRVRLRKNPLYWDRDNVQLETVDALAVMVLEAARRTGAEVHDEIEAVQSDAVALKVREELATVARERDHARQDIESLRAKMATEQRQQIAALASQQGGTATLKTVEGENLQFTEGPDGELTVPKAEWFAGGTLNTRGRRPLPTPGRARARQRRHARRGLDERHPGRHRGRDRQPRGHGRLRQQVRREGHHQAAQVR